MIIWLVVLVVAPLVFYMVYYLWWKPKYSQFHNVYMGGQKALPGNLNGDNSHKV